MLGLVFKTSVGHSVSQVGSTPTSFRQIITIYSITYGHYFRRSCSVYDRCTIIG